MYNQTNEVVSLWGDVNLNIDLSVKVHRCIRNIWCSCRKYALELYDRPSAPPEIKIRMLRSEVLDAMLYGCVTWGPCACHYSTLRQVHHSFLARCIGWRKKNRIDHPIFYLDTLIKTRSENIKAIMRRRRILFMRFVVRMEDTEKLLKCVMFRKPTNGAAYCVEGENKRRVDGVFLGRLQSFRYQRRPVDDCSPGRGGMAQVGATRGGMFHGEMGRCREARAELRYAVICPNLTGRTKESIAEGNRARAVRSP